MNKRKIVFSATTLLCCLLLFLSPAGELPRVAFATAVSTVSEALDWSVLGSGGGQATSSDGVVVINSTFGQPIIGITSSTDIELSSGYWTQGATVDQTASIYLPLIKR